ncbi:MAG: D-aminoacylase [Actinobacteria bacterium]|nr:MAG: D-aminoacylase [Actinomycetota bacterium]
METGKKTVITGATLVDGTGLAPRYADVAFIDGTITEVGEPGSVSTAHAHRHIDADGLLLTPGWVDVHTHYDAQATWDPWLTPSSWHGVTSVVMGNCGVGFAPAAPDRHQWLIDLMEGVEDIPGSAMVEGIQWEWTSFPEYLDALERQPHVLDMGTQIAHGALRAFVMGDRGANNDDATADDISQMSALTEEALRAGALGFSTSRTSLHRSKYGELVPGTTAQPDELYGIADAMKRVGHGIFQFSPEHSRVPVDEWPWMQELARRSGATVSVNVNQLDDGSEVWRKTLALLTQAHTNGEKIVAQTAGRSIGILMCLEGSVHPLLAHPAYHEIAHLPFAQRIAALKEPLRRARFVSEVPTDGFYNGLVTKSLGRMYPVTTANIDYEPHPSTSIGEESKRTGVAPMQLIVDHLLLNDGKGIIYSPFFNYMYGDLSMTYEMMQHPQTRNGLSDAGAHCGAICDGGMPTFMLTHWARDRTRGPKLSIEHIVYRQTRHTAELHDLLDRGIVAPGMKADLNVINFDQLGFDMPYMAYDLPAQGRRLVQTAHGYNKTFVSGVQTVENDAFTGELPGKLIRGPQR